MREGYKQTELGEIPNNWEVRPFTEVTSVITCGVAARPEYVDNGVPFLSSKNVKNSTIIWEGFNRITEEAHRKLTKYSKPEKGDLLYTRVGSFGEAAVINTNREFSVFVSLTLIKPLHEVINSYYLAYLLNSDFYKNLANNSTTGLGVQNLNVNAVRKFPISIPPLPEQEKIAEILSIVGEKITVIDERITQTQELKKGLMQRLFTKGIGHTKFKQSPLGEIPENWEISKIGEVATTFAGGTPKRGVSGYYDGNIPWVKSGEVNQSNIISTEEHITELALKESATKLIKPDSILVALYGATAGNVGRLRIEACSNQAVLAVNSKTQNLTNEFIYHYLKQTAQNLIKLCQGSGQPNLSKGIIDGVFIPLPSLAEQERIAEMLTTVDEKLEVLQEKKGQYQEMKKSLMQQLLTGKLRVNHLIEQAELA